MKGFVKELLQDMWRDISGIWWIALLLFALIAVTVQMSNYLTPPPRPKHFIVTHSSGVYTTDTATITGSCVKLADRTLCGEFVVVEKEGRLPDEQF